MTDRAKAFIVHLDDDYRIGDETTGADRLMAAITCLQGVTKVEPLVSTLDDYLARVRVRSQVRTELIDAIDLVLEDRP